MSDQVDKTIVDLFLLGLFMLYFHNQHDVHKQLNMTINFLIIIRKMKISGISFLDQCRNMNLNEYFDFKDRNY